MGYVTDFELELSKKLQDKHFRDRYFQVEARHEIARQIRALRIKRTMRQVDLAKAANMPQSSVSRIEQADYSGWTFKTLCKVASALDARIRFVVEDAESALKEIAKEEADAQAELAESSLLRSLGIQQNPILGRQTDGEEALSEAKSAERLGIINPARKSPNVLRAGK